MRFVFIAHLAFAGNHTSFSRFRSTASLIATYREMVITRIHNRQSQIENSYYCLLPLALLNHFIRPRQQFVRNRVTDLFCRRKVDDEFKLHRLLHWQVSRFRSLEDSVHVVGCLAVQVIVVHPVEHEAALIDKLLLVVNSRQPVFDGKLHDPLSFGEEAGSLGRHNRAHLFLFCGLNGAL